jgi:hypothetical protein
MLDQEFVEKVNSELKGLFGPDEQKAVDGKFVEPKALDTEVELGESRGMRRCVALAERQKPVGTPGTLIREGRIRQETSHKSMPFYIRGRRSQPGQMETFYRQDSVFRDSVDSVVEVQMGATRTLQPPEDEKLPEGVDADEMAAWCDRVEGYFRGIDGGLKDSYVYPATQSVAIHGFTPFEVIWAESPSEPVPYPVKLALRECSTVDRWIFNDRQDTLVGCQFETSGDADVRYTLSATGPNLEDVRLIVPAISARGNNVEGVAPGRSSQHWLRLKQLLGQIQAAAAQVYGMPPTDLQVDPKLLVEGVQEMVQASDKDVREAIDTYNSTDAVEHVINYLPPPLKAEVASPDNRMPSLLEIIRYCDEQISRPFSNEGALLGHEQVGSYALAQVQDNKFLRSAAVFHRALFRPIQTITNAMTRSYFGADLSGALPTWEMSLSGRESADNMKLLIQAFKGVSPTEWPKPVRAKFANYYDLPEDAFDALDQAVRESAGGTVSNVAADPENLDGSAREPETVTDGAPGDQPVGDAPDNVVQMSEYGTASIDVALSEFERVAPKLEKKMDKAEADLLESWADLARQQREDFYERTKNATTADAIDEAAEAVEREYTPQFKGEAAKVSQRLQKTGVVSQLSEIGVTAPDPEDIRVPDLPPTIKQLVRGTINSAASEASRRNARAMADRMVEKLTDASRGADVSRPDRLADRTLHGIAEKTSGRSLNAGRTAVVQSGLEYHQAKTGTEQAGARRPSQAIGRNTRSGARDVTAVRSSMLDDGVCDACLELDFQEGGPEFVVGSSQYYSKLPPAECFGGTRCRCVMIHNVPADVAESFAEHVNASLVI